MSKGLCNMTKEERKAAIDSRLRINAGGLGTISAKEAVEREIEKSKRSITEALKKSE